MSKRYDIMEVLVNIPIMGALALMSSGQPRKTGLRLLSVLLLAILIWPLQMPAFSANEDYQFAVKWPVHSQPTFFSPKGVAVDGQGNFYVADTYNHVVRKYDKDTGTFSVWGTVGQSGSGNYSFYLPGAVEIDPLGQICVVDSGNSRIQVYNSSGTYLGTLGGFGEGEGLFKSPAGIAFYQPGGSGAFYAFVSDSGNHRIQKFSSSDGVSYTFERKWGFIGGDGKPGTGTANGEFDTPLGVETDPATGDVFVADSKNKRVQRFDVNGTHLWTSSTDSFTNPAAIVVSTDDGIPCYYVSDFNLGQGGGDSYLWKYRLSDNSLLAQYNGRDLGDSQFRGPSGLAADELGNIYVADSLMHRVQKYNPDLIFQAKWGATGNAPGQFNNPEMIAIDLFRNVYVADTGNARIQKFSPSGNHIATVGVRGSGPGELSGPTGIAVDPSGKKVYVVDSRNRNVQKFTSIDGITYTCDSSWGDRIKQSTTFNGPLGIALDLVGNLYITDSFDNKIKKFTPDGAYVTSWGGPGANDGKLNRPGGIVVDRSGRVIVADTYNQRIQIFDRSGRFIRKIVDSNPSLNEPRSVAVDANGWIYVADTLNNRIVKYNASGAPMKVMTGPENSPFTQPKGVAVDATGNVYVSDTVNQCIQKFTDRNTPTGNFTVNGVVLAGGGRATKSATVTLSITASDTLSGIAKMAVANSNVFSGSYFENYAATRTWALSGPGDDGWKTVYIKFKDRAGYQSPAYASSILLDRKPPSGVATTALKINNGAATTTTSRVSLNISISDPPPGSGVTHMMISNSPTFPNATWETYATVRNNWDLTPGNGIKYVYIKFKDAVGNISARYSDDITKQ